MRDLPAVGRLRGCAGVDRDVGVSKMDEQRIGPVYKVPVTLHGQLYLAPVRAIGLLGDYWAIGYITPTGRHKKLTCKGNENVCKSEAEAVERLNRIAEQRGWEKWPEEWPLKCILM